MIYEILIAAFLVLFAGLAYFRLELAVQILIFALPAYLIRFKFFFLPLTMLEAMIWIVFAIWFIRYSGLARYLRGEDKIKRFLADRKTRQPYPFGAELILFLIVSFAAAGVSGFTNSALGIWKAYFFEPLLLYVVVFNVFGRTVILTPHNDAGEESMIDEQTNYRSFAIAQDDKINKIIWPLAWSALVVSLLAIYQKFSGALIDNPFWSAESTRRAVSFFGYPNTVGLYLAPLVMLLFGYFLYLMKTEAKRVISPPAQLGYRLWVMLFSMVLSVLAIYFAKSEGALVALVAGLGVFGLLAGNKSRWAVIILAVLAIGGAWFSPYRNQVITKITLRDFSGTVRRLEWRETWRMLGDGHLIFGAGLANYQTVVKPYHQEGFFKSDGTPDFWQRIGSDADLRARTWQPLEIYLYPHNIFLNFWSELGLAGLLLFVWIIGKYFYIGLKGLNVIPAEAGIQKNILRTDPIMDPRLRGDDKIKGLNVIPAEAGIQKNILRTDPIMDPRLRGDDKIKGGGDDKTKFLVLGLLSAMIAIFVHGLVDVPYFKNDLAVMFWLFVALLAFIRMRPPEYSG